MSSDDIERAIDNAVAAKNGDGAEQRVVPVAIPMMPEAVAIPVDGGMRFPQTAEYAASPRLLVLDVTAGAWRPLLLPPGTWSLQIAGEEQAKPKLWTP